MRSRSRAVINSSSPDRAPQSIPGAPPHANPPAARRHPWLRTSQQRVTRQKRSTFAVHTLGVLALLSFVSWLLGQTPGALHPPFLVAWIAMLVYRRLPN